MKKKNLLTAGLVIVSTFILTAAVGCSSDSTSTSSSATTCQAVGFKNCTNDDPVTQDEYDACKKCESQAAAFAKCQGITSAPKCDANGKSETVKIDLSKCTSELQAYTTCSQGGSSADAGGGG